MSKNRLNTDQIAEKLFKKSPKTKRRYQRKHQQILDIPTKKSKNHKNIDYNLEKSRRDSKNQQKCQENNKYVKKLSKNRQKLLNHRKCLKTRKILTKKSETEKIPSKMS